MSDSKKPEDWMETADRLGQQLTRGIEAFGDKVQKALESIDEMSRPRTGVTIDDKRDSETGEPVEALRRGDVFDHRGALYMRLGTLPDTEPGDEIHAVNLENGDVRKFERDMRVEAVKAKVIVEG